jgi:hypothetical protein
VTKAKARDVQSQGEAERKEKTTVAGCGIEAIRKDWNQTSVEKVG